VHPAGRLVTVELGPAELDILPDLRSWVRDLLTDADACADAIETTMLTLTELATNALTHGAPAGQCRLHVSTGALLRIEVDDGSPASAALAGRRPRPRDGGLGLVLVERLTKSWGQTPTPSGKTVWAEIDLRCG
jgi:two-component sensor histidine kinase